MNAAEFLATYPVKAKLPLTAKVEVLDENNRSILIRINGYEERRISRVGQKYVPKYKHISATSSLSESVLRLPGSVFKVWAWLKSLDNLVFSSPDSAKDLRMSVKTFKTAIKTLSKHNIINLEIIPGVGYSVKLLNEKDLLQ